MGAYATVGIPEDVECGQIELNGSTAWLVFEMCSSFMDLNVDELLLIPGPAVKLANKIVPQNLAQYEAWHLEQSACWANQPSRIVDICGSYGPRHWSDWQFKEAREFLRVYGASVSDEDIDFKY